MTENLLNYANHLNASAEVLGWLNTTGAKVLRSAFYDLTQRRYETELEHILDYLVSSAAPKRLQKMSFKDAQRKAAEWSASQQKKGRGLKDSDDDIETIHDFLDGTRIVKLKSKAALQREGFLMGHCVGGYTLSESCHIYSYRDAKNMPHATFEVSKRDNEIVQIKGKGNGAIHPKYIHPILAFLKAIGMDVRPHDMVNLGYHHLNENHKNALKLWPDAFKQTVVISGETYAY